MLVSVSLIPLEVPGMISIMPFFAKAFKCSSAAFADRKPNSSAMSTRVGGKPVSFICRLISSKIWACLAVRLIAIKNLFKYTIYCYFIQFSE